jgi:hypothetical protein
MALLPKIEGPVSPCYENVNRLGWTEGFVVAPFGTRLGVRVNDSSVLSDVVAALPPMCELSQGEACDVMLSLKVARKNARAGTRHYNLLYAGHTRVARSLDLAEVLAATSQQIRTILSLTATQHALLPGIVLDWRGKTMLMVGQEVEQGLAESFVDGPAQFRAAGVLVMDNCNHVALWRKEAGTTPLPAPVGLILFPRRSTRARKRHRLVRLGRGEATMSLFSEVLSATQKPAEMMKFCAQAARTIPACAVELATVFSDPLRVIDFCHRELFPEEATAKI